MDQATFFTWGVVNTHHISNGQYNGYNRRGVRASRGITAVILYVSIYLHHTDNTPIIHDNTPIIQDNTILIRSRGPYLIRNGPIPSSPPRVIPVLPSPPAVRSFSRPTPLADFLSTSTALRYENSIVLVYVIVTTIVVANGSLGTWVHRLLFCALQRLPGNKFVCYIL